MGFFQFEIISNVFVSCFWFIWIPMLWVYGHQKYFYYYSAGIDFSRQNLTSTDEMINRGLLLGRRRIPWAIIDLTAANIACLFI